MTDTAATQTTGRRAGSRVKAVIAYILVVLGVLILLVSLVANFVRREALDSSTFEKTSEELIADPAVRDAVAVRLVDEIIGAASIGEGETALADTLTRLTGDTAGGTPGPIRELMERAARAALDAPRMQELFVTASSAAHDQVVAVLRDEDVATLVIGDRVVLDLRPLVLELGDRFGLTTRLAGRVPEGAGQVTIMDADDLEKAQTTVKWLETTANWVWALAVAAWAGAIALMRGRRLRILAAIGIGIVLTGALILIVLTLGQGSAVEALVPDGGSEAAGDAVYDIVSSSLAAAAWTTLVVGVLLLIGTWLAGAGRFGADLRSRLTPLVARPEVVYPILAVLVALCIWWSPVDRRGVIVLSALAVIGTELLRRQAARTGRGPEGAATGGGAA